MEQELNLPEQSQKDLAESTSELQKITGKECEALSSIKSLNKFFVDQVVHRTVNSCLNAAFEKAKEDFIAFGSKALSLKTQKEYFDKEGSLTPPALFKDLKEKAGKLLEKIKESSYYSSYKPDKYANPIEKVYYDYTKSVNKVMGVLERMEKISGSKIAKTFRIQETLMKLLSKQLDSIIYTELIKGEKILNFESNLAGKAKPEARKVLDDKAEHDLFIRNYKEQLDKELGITDFYESVKQCRDVINEISSYHDIREKVIQMLPQILKFDKDGNVDLERINSLYKNIQAAFADPDTARKYAGEFNINGQTIVLDKNNFHLIEAVKSVVEETLGISKAPKQTSNPYLKDIALYQRENAAKYTTEQTNVKADKVVDGLIEVIGKNSPLKDIAKFARANNIYPLNVSDPKRIIISENSNGNRISVDLEHFSVSYYRNDGLARVEYFTNAENFTDLFVGRIRESLELSNIENEALFRTVSTSCNDHMILSDLIDNMRLSLVTVKEPKDTAFAYLRENDPIKAFNNHQQIKNATPNSFITDIMKFSKNQQLDSSALVLASSRPLAKIIEFVAKGNRLPLDISDLADVKIFDTSNKAVSVDFIHLSVSYIENNEIVRKEEFGDASSFDKYFASQLDPNKNSQGHNQMYKLISCMKKLNENQEPSIVNVKDPKDTAAGYLSNNMTYGEFMAHDKERVENEAEKDEHDERE